jgi:hypothetical protein
MIGNTGVQGLGMKSDIFGCTGSEKFLACACDTGMKISSVSATFGSEDVFLSYPIYLCFSSEAPDPRSD